MRSNIDDSSRAQDISLELKVILINVIALLLVIDIFMSVGYWWQ